ncbi:type 2 isopentenyl-diphosphate Delta-isomerase [Limosilactobacillus fermentum]
MESAHAQRKNEHLSLAEKDFVLNHQVHPFDQVRLIPNALPEMAVKEVKLKPAGLALPFEWPFYIEAMTGGSQRTTAVNASLARLAKQFNLAMATGSMSVMFNDEAAKKSFAVLREENPDGFLMANLGAGADFKKARQVINFIDADALEIHLNPAQELIMKEGDREFYWLEALAGLVSRFHIPVIVKEVGFGMSQQTISQLEQIGVRWINVAGTGGTNFARIEDRRNHELDLSDLVNWGLSTPESLLEAQQKSPSTHLIASGGITCPLDVIKAGVLGAKAVGVAGYFLHLLIKEGEEGLAKELHRWQVELPRLMTLVGVRNWDDLYLVDYLLSPELESFTRQRGLVNRRGMGNTAHLINPLG